MAYYKIFWKPSAQKELKKLDKKMIAKIIAEVEKLSENPKPASSKKLSGSDITYRIRVNDYRVIYDILDRKIELLVIKIGHRKDIYRNL